MSVSLQVIYPATEGTQFDFDYYLGNHMELTRTHMGSHIDSTVITKGLAGGPGTPPPFHAVATIVFADRAAMNAAMRSSDALMADIPNFTDTTPQILIGEVVG